MRATVKHHPSSYGPRALGAFLVISLAMACSSTPPPRWAQGGSPIAVAQAQWVGGTEQVVTLHVDGSVVDEDDDVLFRIDAAGRVFEDDGTPIGVLLDGGRLVGEDHEDLGRVGVSSAAVPGSAYAWLSVRSDGRVVRYDVDGNELSDGAWTGCVGPMRLTCTLVTHVVSLRRLRRIQAGPQIGVGIGIMVPIR